MAADVLWPVAVDPWPLTFYGPWPLMFYDPWTPLTFHGPWPLMFHGPWPIVCQSVHIQGEVTFLNSDFLSLRCLNNLAEFGRHDTQTHVASRRPCFHNSSLSSRPAWQSGSTKSPLSLPLKSFLQASQRISRLLRSLENRLKFIPSKSMLGGFRVTHCADATGLRDVTLSSLPKTSQLEAGWLETGFLSDHDNGHPTYLI